MSFFDFAVDKYDKYVRPGVLFMTHLRENLK